MFCPQCAAENSDGAKYCRRCRQNLKVISQAMTHSLPLVLASKFDEYLERTNERILRDSIFNFLFGASYLSYSLWAEFSTTQDLSMTFIGLAFEVPFSCFILGCAAWQMLAYKRSKSLSSISAKQTSVLNSIYCPRCAESNKNGAKFCPKCGENLRVVSQAMTRQLPASITHRLDRYIEKKTRNIQKYIRSNAIAGAAFLSLGIFLVGSAPSFRLGSKAFALILFGCLALILAGFDFLAEKRKSYSTSQTTEILSPRSTKELGLQSPPQESTPPSITEATTKRLDERTEYSRK